MGRITLPRKISVWTIIKLFMVSALTFTGYYFYPTLIDIKNNSETPDDWSKVLAVTSIDPVKVYEINTYEMKDVYRPDCEDIQPRMDFLCMPRGTPLTKPTSTVTRLRTFGVTNATEFNASLGVKDASSGIEYYGNPVLEDINGVPLLAYYGGFYEIKLNTYPQTVINISRTFATQGDVGYTAGCMSGWFPSSLAKKGNMIFFGGGGLEPLLESRCYSRSDGGQGEWGTTLRGDVDCDRRAKELNIPRYNFSGPNPTCRLSATESCWDTKYRCVTLGPKWTQYYNYPNITRLTLGVKPEAEKGARLSINSVFVNQGPNAGGGASRDAKSYCIGKTKNDCIAPFSELEYGDDLVLRVSSAGDNRYAWTNRKYVNYGIFTNDTANRKSFYNRVFYGFNPTLTNTDQLGLNFGGYDSPAAAYNLANRVDFFQVYSTGTQSDTRYYKYRLINYEINPLPYLVGFEPTSIKNVRTGVIDDFVSDKYYFTLQYENNTLYLKRFSVTGYSSNQLTAYSAISLPGVSLSYRRNITFNINSGDDIDILIAPNFIDSKNNANAESRMFRAQNFNSSTGPYKLYELDETNGGYIFPKLANGNQAPLTFRYYNNTDADLENDYAIFVSRNYVMSSQVPPSPPTLPTCVPNFNLAGGGLTLINTSPKSLNFGVSPTPDLSADTSLYDLNFAFNSAVNLSCPSGIVPLPAGTKMTLKLFDGITSAPIATTLSANLLTDRKSFTFNESEFPNYKKYFYQVNFTYNGQTYNYPATGIDSNRYFTLESFLNVYTYLDGEFPEPLPNSKIVLTKTFKNISTQFSSPIADPQFSLISSVFPDFYWDHNMTKTGTNLTDSVTYKLCFTNTSDTKVSRIGFTGGTTTSSTSISNNYFTGTLNNGCVNLNYKSSTVAAYNVVPQEIDVYVTTTTIPDPSTYVNFRANGNVMIKNTSSIKSYSTSSNDKKYQGSYLATSSVGDKGYVMSVFNKNTYFNIPYYGKLTNALNFSWTQDLVYFTEPTSSTFKETGTYLLTDRKTDVSASNFDKIDVFTNYQSYTPTIIYVAKNKVLYFDLTDTNIFSSLENTYFVSTDKSNTKERIVFNVNCDDVNYSLICEQNYEYHLKGGIYGDFKLTGKLNAKNATRSFITIHQNPEILILLQKDLRSNKIFNVTRSKTIFKYLND